MSPSLNNWYGTLSYHVNHKQQDKSDFFGYWFTLGNEDRGEIFSVGVVPCNIKKKKHGKRPTKNVNE